MVSYSSMDFFFSIPKRALLHTVGRGSVLLGCCFPHCCQDIAQLLYLLARMCVPILFLLNLRVHLSLEILSSSMAHCSLLWGKAVHLLDYVPHEPDVLGEVPGPVAVPQLVHILSHLVKAHGHRVAR